MRVAEWTVPPVLLGVIAVIMVPDPLPPYIFQGSRPMGLNILYTDCSMNIVEKNGFFLPMTGIEIAVSGASEILLWHTSAHIPQLYTLKFP